jgi:hypothetical protein
MCETVEAKQFGACACRLLFGPHPHIINYPTRSSQTNEQSKWRSQKNINGQAVVRNTNLQYDRRSVPLHIQTHNNTDYCIKYMFIESTEVTNRILTKQPI